jgi:3-methyladenine DNA glycosylase AlkD
VGGTKVAASSIISELKSRRDPKAVDGMARFGISSISTLGVSVQYLRTVARRIGKDHLVAGELWDSGLHEAKILASVIDIPSEVTEAQMELWVKGFDSWDVCDGVCGNLFDKTPLAYVKAMEWSSREEEFVKRAGFVLMAELAVHDKEAPDAAFVRFFGAIKRGSKDDRNFVKKAVNWALRQIGKRNLRLNLEAVKVARSIGEGGSSSERWVAGDALRELTSDEVTQRLRSSSSAVASRGGRCPRCSSTRISRRPPARSSS